MAQKVHCGRLTINKDGVIKKIDLANGGGTRDCILSHVDIGFDEIHDSLRELYKLDSRNRNSKVYDYRLHELDTNRYRTFFEYVYQNGLKFRSTLLYLCTPAADNESVVNTSSLGKNRTTVQNSTSVVRRIPQVEADSSTSPLLIKVDDDDSPDRRRPAAAESTLSYRIIENLRISSTTSFSNYSFEKSLSEFIDYLRTLISQYNHESIFIQLFESICILQGLSSITLDRLKQDVQPTSEHEKQFYSHALDKIDKLSRSIKATIELNKMKISHIDQHSTIVDSFTHFHQNFNTLRDQWVNNNMAQSRQSTSASSMHRSNDPVASTSFSSTNHLTNPPRSITSYSSTSHSAGLASGPTSSSSTNHSNDQMRSTNFSTRDNAGDSIRPTSIPSSSSRHHHSRKQSRALSPSTHRSHRPLNEDENNNDKYSLFQDMLQSLGNLLDVLRHLRFTSFYELVNRIVNDIRACRSNIKLSEYQSLDDAKQLIIAIEKRLTARVNDEYHRVSPHGIHRQLEYSFDKTLDAMKHLLNDIEHYQSRTNNNKRSRKTRWSSPNPPSTSEQEHTENKPSINSNHHHHHHHRTNPRNDDNDDQSSEASNSSFGDEVLMEVARNAYEHRPNRHE